jgi:hypothetical protein
MRVGSPHAGRGGTEPFRGRFEVLVFLIQAAEAIVLVVVAAGDAQIAALVVTVASKAA